MYMDKKMKTEKNKRFFVLPKLKISSKIIMVILLIFLVLFTFGCDTELGHGSEDHDGNGIQDHTTKEHNDTMDEHSEVEEPKHS